MTKQKKPAAASDAGTTPKPPAAPVGTPLASAAPLTDLQRMIADEAADLALNGGSPVVVEMFITALARHQEYRWYVHVFDEEEAKRRIVEERMKRYDRHAAEWTTELQALWQQRRKARQEPISEDAAPTAATQRFRNSVIEELREYFARFLTESNPSERDFILGALRLREGNGFPMDFESMPIAEILDSELNLQTREFIRVPYRLRKAMEAHLELLLKADKCEAA